MSLKTQNKYSIIAIAIISFVAVGLVAIPAIGQTNALVKPQDPITTLKQKVIDRTNTVIKRIGDRASIDLPVIPGGTSELPRK